METLQWRIGSGQDKHLYRLGKLPNSPVFQGLKRYFGHRKDLFKAVLIFGTLVALTRKGKRVGFKKFNLCKTYPSRVDPEPFLSLLKDVEFNLYEQLSDKIFEAESMEEIRLRLESASKN